MVMQKQYKVKLYIAALFINIHTHTYTHVYVSIYICIYVCVYVIMINKSLHYFINIVLTITFTITHRNNRIEWMSEERTNNLLSLFTQTCMNAH